MAQDPDKLASKVENYVDNIHKITVSSPLYLKAFPEAKEKEISHHSPSKVLTLALVMA